MTPLRNLSGAHQYSQYNIIVNHVDISGFDIQYNHPHDLAAIIECYVMDVYHTKNIREGDIVLDLGAGIGEFSILASRKVGASGKVISIESSPDDYVTLLNNVKNNNCSNVYAVNLAVGDCDQTIELEFKGKKFEARCRKVEEILQDVHTNKVNFVKMDIEGAEIYVIPSNESIIAGAKYLSIEMHKRYHETLIPYLEHKGFLFHRVTRGDYIKNAAKFFFAHPVMSIKLLADLRRANEFPGAKKILSGVEIASSNDLVDGTFSKVL